MLFICTSLAKWLSLLVAPSPREHMGSLLVLPTRQHHIRATHGFSLTTRR